MLKKFSTNLKCHFDKPQFAGMNIYIFSVMCFFGNTNIILVYGATKLEGHAQARISKSNGHFWKNGRENGINW